jgi:hypothetical protein
MVGLNPYSIGAPPNFNPCEKCIIQVNCSIECNDKLRWNIKILNRKPVDKIMLNRRRRKKK